MDTNNGGSSGMRRTFIKKEESFFSQTPAWRLGTWIKSKTVSIFTSWKKWDSDTAREGSDLTGNGGSWDNLDTPEGSRGRWGGNIKKLIGRTSLLVGGIIGWALISQCSPKTNEFASDVLHAVWVKQTLYDTQKSLPTTIKTLQASLAKAEKSEKEIKWNLKKIVNEKNKLENQNRELSKIIADHTNKTIPWVAHKELKQKVIAKQKNIDNLLTTFLRLKGQDGRLAHYGIPPSVRDYKIYSEKQDKSLINIPRKIRELRMVWKQEGEVRPVAVNDTPSVLFTTPKTDASKVSWMTASTTQGPLIKTYPWVWTIHPSGAVSEEQLDAVHGYVHKGNTTPSIVQFTVPPNDTYKVPFLEKEKLSGGINSWAYEQIEDNSLVFNQSNVSVFFLPEKKGIQKEGFTEWEKNVSDTIWSKSKKADLGDQKKAETPPQSAHPSANTQNKDTGKAIIQEKNVEKTPTPPSTSLSLKPSALSAENITSANLEEFIAGANKAIISKPNSSLQWASLRVKQIKIKGTSALRVFLNHGNRKAYFTVVPGKKNNNYKYLSSESELLKWAERKMKKWK